MAYFGFSSARNYLDKNSRILFPLNLFKCDLARRPEYHIICGLKLWGHFHPLDENSSSALLSPPLFLFLFVCLPVYLAVHIFVYLSVCLYINPFICPPCDYLPLLFCHTHPLTFFFPFLFSLFLTLHLLSWPLPEVAALLPWAACPSDLPLASVHSAARHFSQ